MARQLVPHEKPSAVEHKTTMTDLGGRDLWAGSCSCGHDAGAGTAYEVNHYLNSHISAQMRMEERRR